MAAGRGPADSVAAPDGLAHGLRHDGIVAGSKGESGAGKLSLRLGFIPVHQPTEPLIEAPDIEGPRGGEGLGAAAAPEGLKGLVGIAAQPTAHAGDSRRGNGGAEAVEALDADEGAERRAALLRCPVKQPEQPKGMSDGDGIARPFGRCPRSAGDEAEIDKRDLRISGIADHIAPDRGVESPAVYEHEMHPRRGAGHAVALRGRARSSSALSRPSISTSV